MFSDLLPLSHSHSSSFKSSLSTTNRAMNWVVKYPGPHRMAERLPILYYTLVAVSIKCIKSRLKVSVPPHHKDSIGKCKSWLNTYILSNLQIQICFLLILIVVSISVGTHWWLCMYNFCLLTSVISETCNKNKRANTLNASTFPKD